MKRIGLLLLALSGIALLTVYVGVGLAQESETTPASVQAYEEDVVSGSYIIVLKDDIEEDPEQVANEMAQQYGLEVAYVYRDALKGFAASVPLDSLDALRSDERVQFISEDQGVHAM